MGEAMHWKSIALVTLVLFALLGQEPGKANANTCQCRSDAMTGSRSYSYQSGPAGICAVAQDQGFCAQAQLQGEGDRLLSRHPRGGDLREHLRRIGPEIDPETAMIMAATIPPEKWPTAQIPGVITTILAHVLGRYPERLAEIHVVLSRQAARIQAAISSPDSKTTERLDEYEAVISYGCVELTKGTFHAQARTPFSKGSKDCSA